MASPETENLGTIRETVISSSQRSRPSRSANELRKLFEQQEKELHETGQHVNRFKSTQYNALRATGREIDASSLRTGRIGENGLHRYDVQPEGNFAQHTLRDYYLKELKDKKGTTKFEDGPLFIVKGLHNYSNLPAGDLRVMRSSTSFHEHYVHPVDRAQIPAKYDHLQNTEATDNDGSLGSISVKRPSTTGSTNMLRASSLARSGGGTLAGGTSGGSSWMEGSATEFGASDDRSLEDLEKEKNRDRRNRFYRNATEQSTRWHPSALDNLEVMLRDKLSQYAGGARGSAIKNAFRFFDRAARGAIDLTSFEKALVSMGFELERNVVVAMFARYDIDRSGSINYLDFTQRVMEPSFVGAEMVGSSKLNAQFTLLLGYLKHHGSFDGLEPPTTSCRTPEEIHALADEDFMERLRLRSVFFSLDKNGNGTIEFKEFQRMLKLLGFTAANPFQVKEMFNFIDVSHDGQIPFDEFYEFYISKPPPQSGFVDHSSSQPEEKVGEDGEGKYGAY